MDELGPLAACVTALLGLTSWRFPAMGAAFLLVGAIPFYAVLALLGIPPSAELTGSTFGVIAIFALARLALRPPWPSPGFLKRADMPVVALMLTFVAVWHLRWVLDPPGSIYHVQDEFADRAHLFMLIFAVVPFFVGLLFRSPTARDKFVNAVAFLGLLNLAVVAVYWVAGVAGTQPEWSETWQPIPFLTSIILSLNAGLGALAVYVLPRARLGALRPFIVIGATAVLVRVGQRGPFLFFLLALLVPGLFAKGRTGAKKILYVAATVLMVIGIAGSVAESTSNRAVRADSYGSADNENRFLLIETAVGAIASKPFIGWGGSMMGRSVGPDVWQYSHVMLLDPLIETGILGGSSFYALLGLALVRARRARKGSLRTDGTFVAIVTLFAYAALESQVSGHVSNVRHFWLLFGIVCAALPASGRRSAETGAVSRRLAFAPSSPGGPVGPTLPGPRRD